MLSGLCLSVFVIIIDPFLRIGMVLHLTDRMRYEEVAI